MVKDPVCGMTVDPKTAAGKTESPFGSEYKGQTYYFCSKGCQAQFDQSPAKFVGGQHAEHAGHHH